MKLKDKLIKQARISKNALLENELPTQAPIALRAPERITPETFAKEDILGLLGGGYIGRLLGRGLGSAMAGGPGVTQRVLGGALAIPAALKGEQMFSGHPSLTGQVGEELRALPRELLHGATGGIGGLGLGSGLGLLLSILRRDPTLLPKLMAYGGAGGAGAGFIHGRYTSKSRQREATNQALEMAQREDLGPEVSAPQEELQTLLAKAKGARKAKKSKK